MSDTSYHYNPATGKTGVCSAKIRCDFDLLPNEHFDNEDDARKAYDRFMASPPVDLEGMVNQLSESEVARWKETPENYDDAVSTVRSLGFNSIYDAADALTGVIKSSNAEKLAQLLYSKPGQVLPLLNKKARQLNYYDKNGVTIKRLEELALEAERHTKNQNYGFPEDEQTRYYQNQRASQARRKLAQVEAAKAGFEEAMSVASNKAVSELVKNGKSAGLVEEHFTRRLDEGRVLRVYNSKGAEIGRTNNYVEAKKLIEGKPAVTIPRPVRLSEMGDLSKNSKQFDGEGSKDLGTSLVVRMAYNEEEPGLAKSHNDTHKMVVLPSERLTEKRAVAITEEAFLLTGGSQQDWDAKTQAEKVAMAKRVVEKRKDVRVAHIDGKASLTFGSHKTNSLYRGGYSSNRGDIYIMDA